MHARFALYLLASGLLAFAANAHVWAQAGENPRAALAAHRYSEAVREADAQLSAHPGDAQLWFVRSLALAGLGEKRKSLASFDETMRLTHDATPVLEAASQVAYGARDPRAGRYLDRLLAADPENRVAHAMAGVLAFEAKDCPSAVKHFAAAGAALAANVAAEMQYGDCLLESGDTAKGVALFEQLDVEHPGTPALEYDRAAAYVQSGRFADAVAVLKAMPTRDADAENLLGAAYNGAGDLAQAVTTYREAAQADPHDERNYIDLATVSVEHQSFEAALSVLDAGIAQNPHSGALLTLRGAVQAQLGHNDAAAADFEAADRLQPSKLYGAVGLGVLLRDTSKLRQAEQLVRARLRTHPKDATLNYLLADVLMRGGAAPGEARFAEARALLVKAVALEPGLAVAYGELGKLDLRAGRTDDAIAELEKGVRDDPADRTSLYQLVLAYRRAGRTQDAARVAAQLSAAVERDRTQEAERNRLHLSASEGGG